MNYILVSVENQVNVDAEDVAPAAHETNSESSPKDNDVQYSEDADNKESEQDLQDELEIMKAAQATSTNKLSTDRQSVSTDRPYVSTDRSFKKIPIDASTLPNADLPIDPNMPNLEDDFDAFSSDGIFNGAYDDENVGAVADFNNMDDTINANPIPTPRIHKNHLKDQILGDPKKKAIGTKWVFKNKKDERSIVVKNKARLIAQGFRQEEGIDYNEVFVPVAKIEAIRLFLAFASYMGFTVYQMDVKSAFLYDTIEEEVYVHQPPGFVDPAHPNKVYKVIKALYGLHQSLRAWYETLSSFLMENGFKRGRVAVVSCVTKGRMAV
ncbi:putative ribonuclease H-like domain-containing protein, partial [Tanacetum coccineum]